MRFLTLIAALAFAGCCSNPIDAVNPADAPNPVDTANPADAPAAYAPCLPAGAPVVDPNEAVRNPCEKAAGAAPKVCEPVYKAPDCADWETVAAAVSGLLAPVSDALCDVTKTTREALGVEIDPNEPVRYSAPGNPSDTTKGRNAPIGK